MKFTFKIQQYQTDAVDAVARVFQGQPYNAGVSYLRDIGDLPSTPQQISVTQSYEDGTQVEFQDSLDDSGFKNEALQLTDEQILRNIQNDGLLVGLFIRAHRARILSAVTGIDYHNMQAYTVSKQRDDGKKYCQGYTNCAFQIYVLHL